MNQQSIPSSGAQTGFAQAARSFEVLRQGETAQRAAQPTTTPSANVEQAIASAAERSGVDFDYLVAQAQVESSMNPAARAATSSATGLYQFIDQTWLTTVHRHGARFGLGEIASQIDLSGDGTPIVRDSSQRDAILALRNDPHIASLMAAGLAEDNRASLAPALGREPNHNELYLAHFLGAPAATRFLGALAQDPAQSAAPLFQGPAAANRAVFYDENGRSRSVAGVMELLSARLEQASQRHLERPAVAQSVAPAPQPIPQNPRIGYAARLSLPPESMPAAARTTTPISATLQATFAEHAAMRSPAGSEQVQRAYARLQALGF